MIRLLILAALLGLALWRMFGRGRSRGGTMSLAEAHALLGVGPDADAQTIRQAHRRLIADAHPDRGGDPGLAARLNAARDRALGACRQQETGR
jgi:DnaJ-domain-containing protein 1